MPSHLRLQSNFEPFSAETTRSYFPTAAAPPAKKQKMSLSQTYYIAASARTKLTHEAQKSDHDLRLLVGHANLLDSLMLELADAEREQEAWFNKTVNKAARAERHIQWADTIDEEAMEDDDDEEDDDDFISDSESDSDYDEDSEDFDMIPPLRRIPSPPVRITTTELDDDEDDEEEDDEEYYEDEEFDDEHALVRSPSQQTPPELVHEEDSDSDDDATPTTPPQPTLEYSEKERQAIATTAYLESKEAQLQATPDQAAYLPKGYFLEQRNAPLITSY
ncbi:hypothetical protein BFW01_g2988 [Lasiodiplodia theobromae]|uniref:Uncharacterized protein n=1 Tax=Lasiodiplodia theobromae TaxID=45133 RepID=A0A5N5DVH3_9PEZI|nr:uncharacterized protein LTHEOB_4027 [Lasiodiplodia theobromae]KAB2580164.1 hypothetical protein DBV05_g1224 [Lasiodiplodia theobromae]KAF4546719.1 hypothetical protein LTHEOB_4027 [Lasiodiplodia theobromae]KAF9632126.1 hypothetical protein BFW01_g2988 [Lasiodiplodia theobromae]